MSIGHLSARCSAKDFPLFLVTAVLLEKQSGTKQTKKGQLLECLWPIVAPHVCFIELPVCHLSAQAPSVPGINTAHNVHVGRRRPSVPPGPSFIECFCTDFGHVGAVAQAGGRRTSSLSTSISAVPLITSDCWGSGPALLGAMTPCWAQAALSPQVP